MRRTAGVLAAAGLVLAAAAAAAGAAPLRPAACRTIFDVPEAPAPIPAVLPDVPTLILAGLDNLRTPAEDAMALAHATPARTCCSYPTSGTR